MSRGATARLFVAIDPPARVREALGAWARDVATAIAGPRGAAPNMRVLGPESLHLTLCFLGGRPVGELEVIGSALAACDAAVGELSLGAPVWLPPRRPRALAVEVRDRDGELAGLQQAVSGTISRAIDWQAERRRFKAHITVARMRGRASGASPSANGSLLPATPQLRFAPTAVVLYRSWLSAAGASYEPIATVGLAGSDR